MKPLDPRKVGICVGLLGVLLYIGWALLSLLMILQSPFFKFLDTVLYIDVDFAIAAIALASAFGFAFGWVGAVVWNRLVATRSKKKYYRKELR